MLRLFKIGNTVPGDRKYWLDGQLILTGSRIADGQRNWEANEDADVTAWNKADPAILAYMLEKP